jgi:hypothetical protein
MSIPVDSPFGGVATEAASPPDDSPIDKYDVVDDWGIDEALTTGERRRYLDL